MLHPLCEKAPTTTFTLILDKVPLTDAQRERIAELLRDGVDER